MSPIQNLEQHARRFIDPEIPLQTRLQLATEVRDNLKITHTSEYLNFLKCYFRPFSAVLLQLTKPQFSGNVEHKVRNVVVEVLNRLPHSGVLRPFVQDLLKVAMRVLTIDNEENGLICMRIIFDLLRNFRPTLQTEFQPFLDFVREIYQNFERTVSYFFEEMNIDDMQIEPSSSLSSFGYVGGQKPQERSNLLPLNPGTRSFKIVTESPLVVMFLFQLYGHQVQTNIPQLLSLMVTAISVQGPAKIPSSLKSHFVEFKVAQVKTVSFLTYLLKGFVDYIKPHEESISRSIVNLLVTCPDSVSIRRGLLAEIGSRFVPLPEERLLAVVHALLHRCYKYPTATTAVVPQSLKKELSGVCRACFSVDTVNKHVDFVREYKQHFEHDLDPESAGTFRSTLSELTERLKHWKNVLQTNVEDRFPAVLKLEQESRVLREFHIIDVEVPGQYFTDQEIAPDHTIKLDRIGADVPIVRRHGSSFRRLAFIGSDGSQHHFLVQTSLTPSARSNERIIQLFRIMNKMFDKHRESRCRRLCFHTPVIIPVWSQVRMVEDDLMYSTFLEVYEINCARNNREADLPITYFKEQLDQTISGQHSPESLLDLRFQTYNGITKNYVSDNVFSQYMYKTLANGNHLWAFKRQFAIQLALSSFMSYILQIGGRSPNKIFFAKNTGKIFQNDFHPEGLLVSAMCAAAQSVFSSKASISDQSQHIHHQLAMFFRDELLSWSWRRPLGMPSATAATGGLNPLEFEQKVATNVERAINRIRGLVPSVGFEKEENATDDPESVQRGVAELVEAALCPKSLCMMDPTWHPWF